MLNAFFFNMSSETKRDGLKIFLRMAYQSVRMMDDFQQFVIVAEQMR